MTTRSELEQALTEAEADFAAAQVSTREAVSSLGAAEVSVGRLLTLLRARQGGGGGGGDDTEYTGFQSLPSLTEQALAFRVGNAFEVVGGSITVIALRALNGNNPGNETLRLWRESDQSQLASVVVSSGTSWIRGDITPTQLAPGSYRLMMDSGGVNRATRLASGLSLPDDEDVVCGPRVSYKGALLASSSAYPSGSADATRLRGMVDIIYKLA